MARLQAQYEKLAVQLEESNSAVAVLQSRYEGMASALETEVKNGAARFAAAEASRDLASNEAAEREANLRKELAVQSANAKTAQARVARLTEENARLREQLLSAYRSEIERRYIDLKEPGRDG